jgi:hypothetical protein
VYIQTVQSERGTEDRGPKTGEQELRIGISGIIFRYMVCPLIFNFSLTTDANDMSCYCNISKQ